jgi:hypothetical protein
MGLLGAQLVLIACRGRPSSIEKGDVSPKLAVSTSAQSQQSAAVAGVVSASSRGTEPAADFSNYPWLLDSSIHAPAPVEALSHRFSPPSGYFRVSLPADSFGSWLRNLPLTRASEPVRSYSGTVLLPPDHPNIAGVVAIDVGNADLQQCADAVIRLHAEWQWSRGLRNMSYEAASGVAMPFEKWANGERPVGKGPSLVWEPKRGKAQADHGTFRMFLDSVFMFVNTGSLARQAKPVALASIRPGDFVVQGGNPGHAVLVLDIATNAAGEKVLLLGQSYMPAQSYQVLRPNAQSLWFKVEPDAGLQTPFWRKFPWEMLRRLD